MKKHLIFLLFFWLIFVNLSSSEETVIKKLWEKNVSEVKDCYPVVLFIEDINKDTIPEVIIATYSTPPGSDCKKRKVLALDGKQGEIIWEKEFEPELTDATIMNVETEKMIVVGTYGPNDYLISAQNGTTKKTLGLKVSSADYGWAIQRKGKEQAGLFSLRNYGELLNLVDTKDFNTVWEVHSNNKNKNFSPNNWGFKDTPTVADLNGDGVEDAILVDNDPKEVLAVDGVSGKEIWRQKIPEGRAIFNVCVADIDKDGKMEVIAAGAGGSFIPPKGYGTIIILSAGNGRVLDTQKIGGSKFAAGIPNLALADLNQDGYLDIIATSLEKSIYALDGKTKKKLWEYKTDHKMYGQPVILLIWRQMEI